MPNYNNIETSEVGTYLKDYKEQVRNKQLPRIKRLVVNVLSILRGESVQELKIQQESEQGLKIQQESEQGLKIQQESEQGLKIQQESEQELKRQQEKKKQELEKQQELKRQEIEAAKRFELYKNFVDGETEKYVKQFTSQVEENNREIEKHNTTCPNCKSKNVVTHFNGKTGKLSICHCNGCSNEWQKKEKESTYKHDILNKKSYIIYLFIRKIKKYIGGEYDDILIDDEEERKNNSTQAFLKDIGNESKYLKNLPIEALSYLYSAQKIENYFSTKTYEYKFSQKIVEVLKYLGFKYGFKE